MGFKRIAVRALAATGVLLICDQIANYTVLGDGMFLGNPVAPFDPPLFSPAQFEKLELIEQALATGDPDPASLRFDSELGWCYPPGGGRNEFTYDWAGCRIGAAPLSRVKAPGVERVVAVGCSMTHGEEVGASETWCARLDAARDDLEVANLGVAAYGIDQSLMRLRRDGLKLEPDVVLLGVLPGAALRLTTLYRPLLRHWSRDVAIKPRFVLEGGALVGIPSPASSLGDVPRLLWDQASFLSAFGPHDHWIGRARAAYLPRGSHWSHHLFVSRLALSLYEVGGRDIPICFEDPAHEVYRLHEAIVLETKREAEAAGARFLCLVLPGRDDLRIREEEGAYWDGWVADLRKKGVWMIDVSEALVAERGEGMFAPFGHYGAGASRIVAERLSEALR